MPSIPAKAALSKTSYGKSRIRLVQVSRRGDRHELRDLTVAIALRRRLRHILYGRRQSRRAADRHDEEYRLRAGGARRRRRARSVRPAARPAFHRPQSEARARRRRSDRSRVGAASPTAPREHGQAFVRRGPDTRTARVVTDRERRGGHRGHRRSRDHEDLALGVRRLSARRIHDAARDARSPARDRADHDLDVSRRRRRLRRRVSRGSRRRCSKPSPRHDSLSVQHTLYAMGQVVLDTHRRGLEHHARDAEPASPAGRSHAVRHGEPQRDLRRDRRAARLDQSHAVALITHAVVAHSQRAGGVAGRHASGGDSRR